ncbi:MAG TPA: hypothetical protein VHD36_00190 [Pirellulales bacterium]|nr:hypothetical protein [Pirellulales bacterium]
MRLINLPGIDAPQGRWISLSPQRRFVCDLMRYAKRVPSVPSQRRMRLAELITARRSRTNRISWCAIFVKAFAIVAAERPELRRAYMPYICPHLYEHPFNVASFSLERAYRGEEGVFFAKIRQPELLSLEELDALVRHHKQAPVESIPAFKQALLLSRLPAPLRRLGWWLGLNSDGGYRAHFFGTFAVSAAASQGAAGLHILSPLTTTLNYGTFEADGSIDVRLTYDHRVLDGAPIARALTALENVLRGEILGELGSASGAHARQPEAAVAC